MVSSINETPKDTSLCENMSYNVAGIKISPLVWTRHDPKNKLYYLLLTFYRHYTGLIVLQHHMDFRHVSLSTTQLYIPSFIEIHSWV